MLTALMRARKKRQTSGTSSRGQGIELGTDGQIEVVTKDAQRAADAASLKHSEELPRLMPEAESLAAHGANPAETSASGGTATILGVRAPNAATRSSRVIAAGCAGLNPLKYPPV